MARYIGPKCKLARRERCDLGLKSGVVSLDSKCNMKDFPGQHGAKKNKVSDYCVQLRTKQKLKRIYGLLERQFRRFYAIASKKRGATGEVLLQLLESRLDNVVYSLGFASTRSEARQLVSHKAISVNGEMVNIPSYILQPGDKVSLVEKAQNQQRVLFAMELAKNKERFAWLSINENQKEGVFVRKPILEELPNDYNVNYVVELYSK